MSVLGILVAFAVTAFAVVLKRIVEWLDARPDSHDHADQAERADLRDGLLTPRRRHGREA